MFILTYHKNISGCQRALQAIFVSPSDFHLNTSLICFREPGSYPRGLKLWLHSAVYCFWSFLATYIRYWQSNHSEQPSPPCRLHNVGKCIQNNLLLFLGVCVLWGIAWIQMLWIIYIYTVSNTCMKWTIKNIPIEKNCFIFCSLVSKPNSAVTSFANFQLLCLKECFGICI